MPWSCRRSRSLLISPRLHTDLRRCRFRFMICVGAGCRVMQTDNLATLNTSTLDYHHHIDGAPASFSRTLQACKLPALSSILRMSNTLFAAPIECQRINNGLHHSKHLRCKSISVSDAWGLTITATSKKDHDCGRHLRLHQMRNTVAEDFHQSKDQAQL